MYPWYKTLQPRAIALPNSNTIQNESAPRELKHFTYRYAIFRMGVFFRWERPSDRPTDESSMDEDVSMDGTPPNISYHELPLRLLHDRERYSVQDVLGVLASHPDIEHIRHPSELTMKTADSLLKNASSQSSLRSSNSSKHVGFAPTPPPFRTKGPITKQTVHLNSTDGLVVVSAFLPVVLNRRDEGNWSADWDYEMLLSMQTHLRVTRVGIVKWRGWHGNRGADGSPEGGVPTNEREKVEACLRPFHCVPVWVEPKLFGEMYVSYVIVK
jgi:hypothetical protein